MTLGRREWRDREARDGNATSDDGGPGGGGGSAAVWRAAGRERRRASNTWSARQRLVGEVRAWRGYAPGARAYVHLYAVSRCPRNGTCE